MYILGISAYFHDSSACLIKDGKVIAAAEEERFSRIKHDSGFPTQAIEFCLRHARIEINDIDYCVYYEQPVRKFERVMLDIISGFPRTASTFLTSINTWFKFKLQIPKKINKELGFNGPTYFVEHHLSHAASAFYPSGFESADIVTIDGVGEWATTTVGRGDGHRLEINKEIRYPDSLGLFYSTITAYLGFRVNNSEYEVMGLSSYGELNRDKNKYYPLLKEIVEIYKDGSYRFDMSYFNYQYGKQMPSNKLCTLLGGPIRKGEDINDRHKDIAAAAQLLTEDLVMNILNATQKETGANNLVMAGGVALNSVINGQIIGKTGYKNIWIQPNASDGGASMGAALYFYHHLLGRKKRYEIKHSYLGPGYSDDHIRRYLDQEKVEYVEYKDNKELTLKTAKLISDDKIIGWFQGRMEWGPRALGARSILANPCNPEMKDIINSRVKHRQEFRPFAPAVIADAASQYFDINGDIPVPAEYMLMVYPVIEDKKNEIPSVTHVDGTGRLQVVKKERNSLYYQLIKDFGNISDVPIVINTSFNVRGEPIVATPEDAYRCMMSTGIDYLVMGKYIIAKQKNEQRNT